MWQKCPICNGTGRDSFYQDKYCTTCNGYKIINELTGLPPTKTKEIKEVKSNLENLSENLDLESHFDSFL